MIVILKRSSAVLLSLIFVLVGMISGAALKYLPLQASSLTKTEQVCVIVDPGHGTPDGGAVGVNGTMEKDINLAISLKLREVLEGKGMRVVMTRSDDNAIYDENCSTIREKKRSDMAKRLEIMQNTNADLFVSIHMNSFPESSASGLHLFYAKKYEKIKPLAEDMQRRMSSVTKAKMHVVKAADSKLFLMKNPPLASILIECGFLSNAAEEKKLNDEEYQAKLAWAIADAIDHYYE